MDLSDRVAILDLGTNTFHLLIAEGDRRSGKWEELYRTKTYVHLAETGIARIGEEAFMRALSTVQKYKEVIDQYGVTDIIAVGTAALRKAVNAPGLLAAINNSTGITPEVIPGDREAALIARGVLSALPASTAGRPLLIMDIGGGSVEMIVTIDGQMRYAESFPVGVAVLYDLFHKEEPLPASAITAIDAHLQQTFAPLTEALQGLPPATLVGASGTFDVIAAMVHQGSPPIPCSTATVADFRDIYARILPMTLDQRLGDPDIPEARARYIVVALQLIHDILRQVSNDSFFVSSYALMEGLLAERFGSSGTFDLAI